MQVLKIMESKQENIMIKPTSHPTFCDFLGAKYGVVFPEYCTVLYYLMRYYKAFSEDKGNF